MAERPVVIHRYEPRQRSTMGAGVTDRPHIPLWLLNGADSFKENVIVDLGADISRFPHSWRERLGIPLEMCKTVRAHKFDGTYVPVPRVRVPIPAAVEIPGMDGAAYHCELLPAFADGDPLVGLDFLQFFKLGVDDPGGELALAPHAHTRLVEAPAPTFQRGLEVPL